MEKRRSKRHARRLKVRFGEQGTTSFPHSGLTNDVSASGMFVVSSHNLKAGTRVHLEVTLPGELPLFVEGVVARQMLVPPELRQVMKSGFGVRYLHGAELMGELVPTMTTLLKDDPYCLHFEDEAQWREALEKEFKRGGAFLWTSKPVAQNAIINVTFDLRFLGRQLSFEAKVVHTMPCNDGRYGVALMFVDPAGAVAALTSALGS